MVFCPAMFVQGNALVFDLLDPESPPATHNIDEYRPAVTEYIVALFRLLSDECTILFALPGGRPGYHADPLHQIVINGG